MSNHILEMKFTKKKTNLYLQKEFGDVCLVFCGIQESTLT